MAHERKLIRAAIVAKLAAKVASVATRVTKTRLEPVRTAELPCINVYTTDVETVSEDSATSSPRELTRTARIAIDCWAKADANVDDVVDDLAEEVEAAMDDDVFFVLGNAVTIEDVILSSTEIGLSNQGERPMGVAHLEYAVTYRTGIRRPAPTDKFNQADTRISIDGAQAPDDQTHDFRTGINQEP